MGDGRLATSVGAKSKAGTYGRSGVRSLKEGPDAHQLQTISRILNVGSR